MNPFLIIAALLILYSLKTTNKVFSLSGVPAVPKQQHKPDKPSGRSVIDPGSIHVDLLRTAICNQKKKIQPGNNDISPAVQQGIYLGTIVLCSIELYFDRRNPEYLHVTAIRCFCDFISAYLCWMLISSKEDILKVVNILLGASLIICTYAFIEKFLGYNPVMDYEIDLAGPRATDWQYLEDERGTRVQSFFLHPIGGSINFGLIFCLCLYGYVYYKAYFSKLQQKPCCLSALWHSSHPCYPTAEHRWYFWQ